MAIIFYCLFRSFRQARNSVIVFYIMPSDLLPSNLGWLLLIVVRVRTDFIDKTA